MASPRRIDAAPVAWVIVAALLNLAPIAASARTVSPPIDGAARAAFDLTVDQTKSAMLGDPVRAERLAREAAALASRWPAGNQRALALATAQWLEGEGAYRTNNIVAAEPLIAGALKTVERVAPGSKLNADLLLSRARIAVEQGKPQPGLADLQRAYAMFAGLGDARSEAKALQSIGSIYQDAQDYDHVLYYYRLASEVYPADPTLGLSASNNMANAYSLTGRHDAAEAEYRHALVIARTLKSSLLTARILDNIADLQIIKHDYAAARATIAEGLALTAEPKAAGWRPMLLGTSARLELAEGHPAAAVRAVEAAFAKADNAATDQSFRPVHLTAYRAYKVTGDYRQALVHLEAFRALDDAGRTLATSTSSALMAARFDFANQNVRIATLKTGQLQRDVALAQLEARQRTTLLAGLLVIVGVAGLFLIAYLRSLRRSRNEVLAANRQLELTNTELAEALLVKSQFLATTSHEIRTPLNGILGMTQVMLADRDVTGQLRDRIGLVHSAGRAMRTLVDDILDFAKMDSGSLAIEAAAVDIAAVMPDLVALWRVEATDKGIGLQLDVDDGVVPVVTDIVRLRQIIFNLLSNAIKFTTEGSVRVAVAPDAAGHQLVITFRDSGVGIPAAAYETIFEPFRQLDTSTTRRFGGTGLGLAISRHLARALGGDITVESVIDVGSTFSVRLPYTRAAPVAAPAAAPAADRAGRSRPRLLIVGPNPIGRSMLRTRLDPHFDRCAACEIDEAVARVEQGDPDLVLIDADTLAAEPRLTALIDALAALPGIAIAVLGPPDLAARADELRAHGAAAVIVKPVSADALIDALSALSVRNDAFA